MRTATFDIETTDLAAVGAGLIMCACVRPHATQRTRTFRIDKYKFKYDKTKGFLEQEETALLKDILGELSKYDMLVGHNIDKFDVPFIRSRSYRRGLDCRLWPFTYDTKKAFRRVGILTVQNGYGKPSAGLAHVVDYFGIKQEKNGIYPVQHWLAIWGNEAERTETLNNLTDHCERDVRMNWAIFPALLESDNRAIIRRLL